MNTLGIPALQAQAGPMLDVGVEIQQYPTGFLFGINAALGFADRQAFDLRIGYNGFDHEDFGVQESEIGGGYGFSLGYNFYLKPTHRGLFFGLRSDFWWNEVDWFDDSGLHYYSGTTNITVWQPTTHLGYTFLLNERWVLAPRFAAGAEINIKTEGAEVGQGAILLWGVKLAYRIKS